MSEAAAAASASPASNGSQGASQASGQTGQGAKGSSQSSQGTPQRVGTQQTAGPKNQSQAAAQGATTGQAPDLKSADTQAALEELAEDNMNRVVKIKVNGQVKTLTVKEALKLAEKGEGADQKFQEAAKIQGAARKLAQLAKDDPESFMRQWGIDPDQYSQARLAQKLEREMMTEEQRELADLRSEKALRDKETKLKEEQDKQSAEQTRMQAADKQLRGEFMKAWEASGLPAHPTFGVDIAREMIRAQANGSDLTPSEAAAKVKEAWITHAGNIFEQMDAQAIHQMLPKSVLTKLREFEVQRVTSSGPHASAPKQNTRPATQSAASTQAKNGAGKRMLSESEWREYFKTR